MYTRGHNFAFKVQMYLAVVSDKQERHHSFESLSQVTLNVRWGLMMNEEGITL